MKSLDYCVSIDSCVDDNHGNHIMKLNSKRRSNIIFLSMLSFFGTVFKGNNHIGVLNGYYVEGPRIDLQKIPFLNKTVCSGRSVA